MPGQAAIEESCSCIWVRRHNAAEFDCASRCGLPYADTLLPMTSCTTRERRHLGCTNIPHILFYSPSCNSIIFGKENWQLMTLVRFASLIPSSFSPPVPISCHCLHLLLSFSCFYQFYSFSLQPVGCSLIRKTNIQT